MDDIDQLHAHISNALLACERCLGVGGICESVLIEVAKLLTAAQSKLHRHRAHPPRIDDQTFGK